MTDAVERGARLIAHEHGSEVFSADHVPYEYTDAERDQYRSEAEAVIRDVIEQLRGLAGQPELVIDGPGIRLPVDPMTAMRLLDRAVDWLEKGVRR